MTKKAFCIPIWNEKGISIIYTYSAKGDCLVNQIKDFNIKKIKKDNIQDYNFSLCNSTVEPPERKRYSFYFQKKGIEKATLKSKKFKKKLVYILRNMKNTQI